MLSISESLLLLGLNEEKGSVVFSASNALPYGLAGAVLLDLCVMGKIKVNKKKIKLNDPSATENPVLNEALELLKAQPREKNAQYWVSRIHWKIKKLHHKLADSLIEKNILSKEEKHFLGIFPYKRYPEQNALPEIELRNTMRSIVRGERIPETNEIALLGLIKASELITEVFPKDERKSARKRIKEIMTSAEISKAVEAIVMETTLAVMSGVVAATAATTAAAT